MNIASDISVVFGHPGDSTRLIRSIYIGCGKGNREITEIQNNRTDMQKKGNDMEDFAELN